MVLVRSDDPSLHTVFRVKYVAEGLAYLEGGRAQGLAEGVKLEVKDTNLPARQGDSVSADVKAGDLAYLSSGDAEALVAQRALSSTRQYPAVISFSEGDTLDEEAREEVPRPPLPSVNRARGRIGLDYITTMSQGTSSMTSSDLGFAFRGDITRIGGTYWNLSGYYRGRLTSQSAGTPQTVQDLINHTYHLSMTYDNPNSNLVAGFGRLYLPWAASLDTIDGGYFGTRLSKGATVSAYDYLVILANTGGELSLSESRLPVHEAKADKKNRSMLVSNGFATLFLMFHPLYANSFEFSALGEEVIDGHRLTKVAFRHIRGTRTPAALALRGREYPLELSGTAWINADTAAIAKISAGIENTMVDVGLNTLQTEVEFAPFPFHDLEKTYWFPLRAVVEVETPRQHWRNTHQFTNYKRFSVSAEEQIATK
jgi:hypothetical protein